MNERPPQPPEGKLIADALKASGLSIREASRRAAISYGRWRQIASGVQNVSPGSYAQVHAPPATLARMAAVVGVTPEQLEEAGRPDAAEFRRAEPRPQPPTVLVAEDDEPEDEWLSYLVKSDPVVQALWRLQDGDGRKRPAAERTELIRVFLRLRSESESRNGNGGHAESA